MYLAQLNLTFSPVNCSILSRISFFIQTQIHLSYIVT